MQAELNNSELPLREDIHKQSNLDSFEVPNRSFRQLELDGDLQTLQKQNIFQENTQFQIENPHQEAYNYDENKNTNPKSPNAEREVKIDIKMNDTPLYMEPIHPIPHEESENFQNPPFNPSIQNHEPKIEGNTHITPDVQLQPITIDNQPVTNPMVDPNVPVEVEDIAPVVTRKVKKEVDADIRAQKCNWHIACLIFNTILWIFVIICISLRNQSIIWAWLILGAAIFGYYQDCKRSATADYLKNGYNPKEAGKELEKILLSSAGIKFHIVCYHYITKVRKVRRNKTTVEERYQEKVTTHNASSQLVFKEVVDQTGKIDFDANYVTRLHLLQEHLFVDKRSENLYKRQKAEFFNANRKDAHNDFSENFFIENFKENLLIVPVGAQMPLLFNFASYIIFSVIGLSWFYRMWFDMKTAGKVLTIKKAFRVDLPAL